MLLLLGFAFLSGLVTILAPCIWPLLPIILSTSISQKGHKRPLGITLGIMLSFGVFTLAISTLINLFHLDPNLLRFLAVIVIAFLGLTMLIPTLGNVTELLVSRLSGMWGQTGQQKGSGFTPGFLTGLSLGIVWSPCAGPILAAIATLAATGKVSGTLVLITAAYVIGVGIPLFIFAYGGQQLFTKAKGINKYTGRIQQVFGIVMLLTAFAIYTNFDKTIQTTLLDAFPALNNASSLGNLNNADLQQQLNTLKGTTSVTNDTSGLFNANSPAPKFVGITKWLNTDHPLTLQQLKGKVVLVDFWTYTCINCIRTLPHVTNWYDKYHTQGFVVVGVHTPEFAFEHETSNVEQAIKQFNIHYPVAQDNDYATWNAYNNEYWPAEYLIDTNGIIRRTEFGEGEYDKTEMAIQQLLKESGKNVTQKLSSMPDQTPQNQLSPETYVGAKRMEYLTKIGQTAPGTYTFANDENINVNEFSFAGQWNIADEYATSGSNAAIYYNFVADKVFLVLHPPQGKTAQLKVILDEKPIDATFAGADVKNGIVTIDQDRLYNLVDLHGKTQNHLLKLEFLTPGTEAFAFTFG